MNAVAVPQKGIPAWGEPVQEGEFHTITVISVERRLILRM